MNNKPHLKAISIDVLARNADVAQHTALPLVATLFDVIEEGGHQTTNLSSWHGYLVHLRKAGNQTAGPPCGNFDALKSAGVEQSSPFS